MKLGELTRDLQDATLTGDPDVEIKHVEYDSRLVKEESLFFAIKGFQRDGYDFVEEAVSKGAVAVIGERKECEAVANHVTVTNGRKAMADVSARFYGYPGRYVRSCGVTGTNGKTTTCYLIRSILQAAGRTTGLVSSLEYDTGSETIPAERTTPESLDLQRLLYLMRSNHCTHAVIEVSSHSLTMHRVDNISFQVAVYTNISRDHLDYHADMDDYLRAKKRLLDCLEGSLAYAVINLDVPEFRGFFGEFDAPYIGYSLENDNADVYCEQYDLQPNGTVLDLKTPLGTRTIRTKLPGRFNLINAVGAASAGLALGIDVDAIVHGLESVAPIPGRFQPVIQGQPFAVYVDFAHTPDALERLCQSAREVNDGRLLLLFGCGGDRDRGKRPLMGEAATTVADSVVVTSDNPRSEDPEAIIDDIKPGLKSDNYEIHVDRRDAINRIMRMAQERDVVILAGKGAETYQEIKGERFPFDEVAEARSALSAIGYTAANSEEHV